MDTDLHPEFDRLLADLAASPAPLREMWYYAIARMLIDDKKARVIETHQDGERLHIVAETLAGKRCSVVRPEMSEEMEQLLLQRIRQLVGAERGP